MDAKSLYGGNSSESLCFLISGDKGSVYLINENAKFFKLYQMDSSVVKLLYNHEKSMLISVTNENMLGQYIIKSSPSQTDLSMFDVKNLMTVKLNGKSNQLDFAWIGSNLLAYASGENTIRMLDVEKDETFTLNLQTQMGYALNEGILSLTYSAAKGIIAAGTDRGNVAMWKFMQQQHQQQLQLQDQLQPELNWQLMHSKSLQNMPIKKVKFGTNLNLLCANLEIDAYILSEQKMSSDFRDGVSLCFQLNKHLEMAQVFF